MLKGKEGRRRIRKTVLGQHLCIWVTDWSYHWTKKCEDSKFIAHAALSPHNFPTHMFLFGYVAL